MINYGNNFLIFKSCTLCVAMAMENFLEFFFLVKFEDSFLLYYFCIWDFWTFGIDQKNFFSLLELEHIIAKK